MSSDAWSLSGVDDPVMLEPESVELDARLKVSEDHLSGEISVSDGRTTAFDGWLGLIGAIESALDSGPPEDDE